MKVLYVADRYDPRDHNAGSGTDYENFQALEKNGFELALVGPFKVQRSFQERVVQKLLSFTDRRSEKYPKSYLRHAAVQVEMAIRKENPDVIFTKSAAPVAYAKFNKPLVYMLDTSLIGQQQQWPTFTRHAYKQTLAWESRVIRESSQIITFSKWSADILASQYQVPADRISYFAIPASIPESVIPPELPLVEKKLDPIRLLLVGRTYHRKGIDIALQVVESLNDRGIPTELRVVGLSEGSTAHVRFMGLYNKTKEEELAGYISNYQWAHFLIHPARFEAAGIVPAEAAAFGVPTITNDVGGLGTTVEDGVSGVVLPKDSPVEAYVEAILRYARDREAYLQLCRTSRERYMNKLNWTYAGKQLAAAVERAAASSREK